MSAKTFAAQMAPFARKAAAGTGLPPSIILAQWGIETAWGTSKNARVRRNMAGITLPGAKSPDGVHPAYRVFVSLDAFTTYYVGLINRRYGDVVKVAKDPKATLTQIARAFGRSPWAADHYRQGASGDEARPGRGVPGTEGFALMAAINAHGLRAYDRPPVAPAPKG